MNIQTQIDGYIESLPAAKRNDMKALHAMLLQLMPGCRLWFLDGKDENGKTVSNPNIGYGLRTMKYADGTARPFYQAGISANTGGISVYILGIEDKACLKRTYGKDIGKAKVTGYCIRFRKLSDIDTEVLSSAIRFGISQE